MKNVLFSLVFTFFVAPILAQNNTECWTIDSDTSDRSTYDWGTTCYYLDSFKLSQSTTEKIVRVNFHVIQDENGNNNFQESDSTMLRQIFETEVNSNRYINNAPHSDPMPGVQDTNITKVRFQLMGIHFHQDPIYWNYSNFEESGGIISDEVKRLFVLNQNFGINLESELNIYFVENTDYNIPGGRIQFFPEKTGSKYKQGVYLENFYADSPQHQFGQTLAHELGHHLGLYHPYNGGDGHNCSDPNAGDDLDDTWCPDAGGVGNNTFNGWCDPYYSPNDSCSNNIMAYSRHKTYHSPLQIAVMHYTLTATSASRFLLPSSYPPAGDIIVTGTEIWDNPKAVNGNIVIENGGSLELECVVRMAPEKKIVVKKGGQLLLHGGSVLPLGAEKWHGIEVQGDPASAQYPYSNQGYLEMTSGMIANSHNGIYTYKEDFGSYIPGYEGGIIKINGNSQHDNYFLNNTYDITIYGNNLLEANSHSSIKGAKFYFYEKYNLGSEHTINHISIYDEDRIELENIDLRNFYMQKPDKRLLPVGLYLHDANAEIELFSDNYFLNMKFGILAQYTDPTKTFSITSSYSVFNFVNNFTNIYASGVSNLSILSTPHKFLDSGSLLYDEEIYCGIYLDNCTGYHIEDNDFYSSDGIKNIGILVNSSGDELNVLYRNYFTNMEIGIGAEGDNRGTTISDGLKIKCNDFTNCEADIKVVPDLAGAGISRYQGNNNSVTGPAGNLFSKNNNSNPFSDFNNTNTYAPIAYVHHTGDPDNDDWVPKYYSSSTIGLKDANIGFPGFSEACPSNLDSRTKSELNTIVSSNQTLLNDADIQLNLIEDGGITSQLLTEVETSQPGDGYELQSQLLQESSNLSDDVMESSIQKEDVLNEAQLTEVLSANPQAAKSERIKLALDNRNNPLPDYMIEQINQGVSSMSLKEMVEADKSYYLQEMRQAQYNLLHKYKLEEEYYSIEEFIAELEGMDMPHATYTRAFQQLKAGNISQAESIINTIPQEYSENQELLFDHEDYIEYFELLKEMQLNNLRVEELSVEQISILEDLAYEIDNYSNVYARNMLNRFNGEHPMPSFAIFGDNNKVSTVSHLKSNEEVLNTLKVYPNPANHHVTVEIEGDYYDNTEVIILDKLGRVQKSISFNGNVKTIQTQNLPGGTYIIHVIQGNQKYTEIITIE